MDKETFPLDWSSFSDHFSSIEDFRNSTQVTYPLIEILFLVLVGVICDCEGWEEIEDFGNDELEWLRQYYGYESGIASHDTLNRVISLIDDHGFEQAFLGWASGFVSLSGLQVNIDGKTVRGSRDKFHDQPAVHLVNAWCGAYRLSLGQIKTSDKSNEITAIPHLLDSLALKGSMVSIDAMGC